MTRKTMTGLSALFLAMVTGSSQAQTIYNDGGAHTVSGTSGPIFVENGSTLNVNAPASISGGAIVPPLGYTASIYGDASSTINLTGGQVLAPVVTLYPPAGMVSGSGIITAGAFSATGGLVQGANGNESGGFGLLSNSSVQVSGGTFQGGNGAYGGVGAAIAGGNNQILISGGTFQGGSSSPGDSGGTALQLQLVAGTSQAEITGGNFLAGSGTGFPRLSLYYQAEYQGLGSSKVDISGGVFSGGMVIALYKPQDSLNFFGQGFTYANGTLTGTLKDGNHIDVNIIFDSSVTLQTQNLQGGSEEISFTDGGPIAVPEPSYTPMVILAAMSGLIAAWRRRGQG